MKVLLIPFSLFSQVKALFEDFLENISRIKRNVKEDKNFYILSYVII